MNIALAQINVHVGNFAAHLAKLLTYTEKAKAQGAEITFLTQENAGHFFLREPERAAQTQASVNAFLDAEGF